MDDFNDTPATELQARDLVVGQGREKVEMSLEARGRDWVLTIGGGDTHVGAVAVVGALGQQGRHLHESLEVVPGHKEGPLALAAARKLAAATGRTCVCIAGIHQDDATASEIRGIVANVERGTLMLIGD